jgi:hypothetical protein
MLVSHYCKVEDYNYSSLHKKLDFTSETDQKEKGKLWINLCKELFVYMLTVLCGTPN